MVKVDIVRNQNSRIRKIKVWDHAGSGDYGFDLVCAGVSAIMIGALNAFDQMSLPAKLSMDASPMICIDWTGSEEQEEMMEIIYIQLKTIEEQYGNYIVIKEKEEIR